jgi:signal transduction histidine kinase
MKQLYALLENLLTWSSLQRGVMQYRPEKLPIDGIIRENIGLFGPKAEQKQITLTHTVSESIRAYADYPMIDTVLRNLISNALKFTHAGDRVEVSATQIDDEIEITVSDTGVGISHKDLAKLFQIESKYTRMGTAGEEGTGLGLILCKELVKRNNGRIWVESEEGQGTTFKFTLPKAHPNQ